LLVRWLRWQRWLTAALRVSPCGVTAAARVRQICWNKFFSDGEEVAYILAACAMPLVVQLYTTHE
jgi:hypothetical protein